MGDRRSHGQGLESVREQALRELSRAVARPSGIYRCSEFYKVRARLLLDSC